MRTQRQWRELTMRIGRLKKFAAVSTVYPTHIGGFDWQIDPLLAKQLRDDVERRDELSSKGDALAPAEQEEKRALDRSISERIRSVPCPDGYNREQFWSDDFWRGQLSSRRLKATQDERRRQTAVEDFEHAQLTVRALSYAETAEFKADKRMGELGHKRFLQKKKLSPEENREYAMLSELFPTRPTMPRCLVQQKRAQQEADRANEQTKQFTRRR